MEQDYLISNKQYDLLKRTVTIGLPGVATLYAALAALWNWSNTDAVLGTLVAITTFGGVVMRFATNSYDNSDGKYDGQLVTTGYDPDTGIPNLQLDISGDPNELVAKSEIVLRSIDETGE